MQNDKAHQIIAEQLKEHSITRRYHAIVHGKIKEDNGVVNAPIGRHPIDRKKMSTKAKNGKHAVTHYTVCADLKIILISNANWRQDEPTRFVFIWQALDIPF